MYDSARIQQALLREKDVARRERNPAGRRRGQLGLSLCIVTRPALTRTYASSPSTIPQRRPSLASLPDLRGEEEGGSSARLSLEEENEGAAAGSAHGAGLTFICPCLFA